MTITSKYVLSLVFVIMVLYGISNCQEPLEDISQLYYMDFEGQYDFDFSHIPLLCDPVSDTSFEVQIQYYRYPYTQEEIQPLIDVAKNVFDFGFFGQTIDEAIEILPQVFNQAANILLFQFPNEVNITYYAMVEGLLQSQNGSEIFFKTIEQPQLFVDTIVYSITNIVNMSCYDDPDLAIGTYLIQSLEPILKEEYRDELADFVVGFAVDSIKQYNVEEQAVAILDPMISALQESGDAVNLLSGLLDLASSDVVAVAVEQAMQAADIEIQSAEDWGKTVALLFDEVANIIDVQGPDFTNYVIESLQEIVLQLQ